MMTETQREAIRSRFAVLGIDNASEQFAVVRELTGQTVSSVGEVTAEQAQRLIDSLTSRIRRAGRTTSGNAWTDRDSETWIDKL